MKIFYCHSCDEVFATIDTISFKHCPMCGAHDMLVELTKQTAEGLSDRLIEDLWMIFADCEYDSETETTLENFMDFPAGTWREDIWHWFDKAYSKGVHELVYM